MDKIDIVETNKPDFRSSIPDYNDEKILAILKKRKHYQTDAVNLAIKEAVKRGLINSEQDLFSEKFNEKPSGSFLFPEIFDDKIKDKIRKSVSRTLLLIGIIPVVWGILEITQSNFIKGVLPFLLGVVWVYASVQLLRSVNMKMVNLLFLILAASIVYMAKTLSEIKGLGVMDYFIPLILFAFITYGLLFIRRLK